MALLSTIFQALFRKGILVGVLLGALIGIVELGLWIFAAVPAHTTYSYRFSNALEPYGLASSSLFEVDTRGVRKREAPKDRDRTLEVLLLDGEGNYQLLQDTKDTWWGRMANELESQFPEVGLEISVKASPAGARPDQGTSIRQALQWAKAYAPGMAPDVLVVSFGISEVLDVPPSFTYNPLSMAMLPEEARSSSFKDGLVKVSQMARRIRRSRQLSSDEGSERRAVLEQPDHFLTNLGNKRLLYNSMRFDAQPPHWPEENDPMLDYLDGLRAFLALAQRIGAELVVLGEPSMHDEFLGLMEMERLTRPRWLKRPTVGDPTGSGLRPDPGWVEMELNRYYRAAASWAAKENVVFVDLNRQDVLPKVTANFVDDSMLTNAGSQRVADEVAPSVASAIKKVLAK